MAAPGPGRGLHLAGPVRPTAPPPRHGPPASVYVHAPFCARRCYYCDFAVKVDPRGDPEGWLRSLEGELRLLEAEGLFGPAASLETLYVGGGTPSLLGPGAMAGLARILGPERLGNPALECTAEANPESFTPEVAAGWREAGLNRLSFGTQSFEPRALSWMGRLHGPEGSAQAVRRARAVGIDNLSVDLIFGLPAHLARDWDRDLDRALALDVPHLSLYGLSVEGATPLGRAVAEGKEPPLEEERYRDEFLRAGERLVGEGYLQYEVSNFARPGFESRHNRAYWEEEPYLGLGNGAHSYRHPLRRWNLRDWGGYQEAVARGSLPVEETETLAPGALRLERIWLGLRAPRGVDLVDLPPEGRRVVEGWVGRGLAQRDGGAVRLIPEGWLLLDQLAVELDEALDSPPPGGAGPAAE